MKKILSLSLVALLVYFPISALGAFDTNAAQTYLSANNNNPWVTMALVASGASNISSNHLTNITPSSAIEYAAPILAITALNQDPSTFGSSDLVSGLKSHHNNSQIGDTATLNDDIFGILALISAGESASDLIVTDAKNFILANQNSDGGWGFTTSSNSDTNMTATAIMAILSAGVSSSNSQIQQGVTFLQGAQNDDGGFPYDPESSFGTASDSSSTAWVIWALTSLNISPNSWTKPNGDPISYLENTQASSGYFEYQTGAGENAFTPITSAYAVIALNNKTLPINTITQSFPTIPFRIEGSAGPICSGSAYGPSALDLVENVASACNFTYNITQTSFGPYLDTMGSDSALGFTGWLYLVNYESLNVGAADYKLQENDTVIWFYGDFGSPPTRLTINPAQINTGESASVTVESYKNNTWSPLDSAEVFYGTNSVTTNSSGQTSISPNDGFFQVYAQKAGFVRSNSKLLEVGNPPQASVNLSVNVTASQVDGTENTTNASSISFTVNPAFLNFGTLTPGAAATQSVTLTGSSTSPILVRSVIEGNGLFIDNIKIGSSIWKSFQTSLGTNETVNFDVGLSIPNNFVNFGAQSGTLTFWAQAQ